MTTFSCQKFNLELVLKICQDQFSTQNHQDFTSDLKYDCFHLGPSQQSIIFYYWTLKRLLTYLITALPEIVTFKMLFNIIILHFYI